MHCDLCVWVSETHRDDNPPEWVHELHHLMKTIERKLDHVSENQTHLEQDVAAIGTAFAVAIAELKQQVADGQTLDFTSADALVAQVQAEAAADAPVPPVEPTA